MPAPPPEELFTVQERSLLGKYAALKELLATRPRTEPAKAAAVPTAEDARSALAALAALQQEEKDHTQAPPSKRGPSKRALPPKPTAQ
jgi:hypothetical protein